MADVWQSSGWSLSDLRSPAFVIDYERLRENGRILETVQQRSGARILLALKGFAAWCSFPVLRPYLAGTCASGPIEARLGREEFGKEVHVYAPAYREEDLEQCLELCDHVNFNSFNQWGRFQKRCLEAARSRPIRFGLRINPEHSEVKTPLYDPCRPGSRLGITFAAFEAATKDRSILEGISGLHFHTLCELNSDALERTLAAVEHKWAEFLPRLDWVNFGGGHHITRPDYDRERLIQLIQNFKSRYDVDVYLEPGEAVALEAGILLAEVLDIVDNGRRIAILDVSATAHMPDVLEMPYRPRIDDAGEPGELGFDYDLGGGTCLAGDTIGTYSFKQPLKLGDRLVFRDMAIYSMVKTTMFNGVAHPDIVAADKQGPKLIRRFGYADYKGRLS